VKNQHKRETPKGGKAIQKAMEGEEEKNAKKKGMDFNPGRFCPDA